ncbi:uncharacterized protein B0I36DRAFT_389038 [Microdochium trichocladiopsis]|uniref:Ankyrin repeat-containing domain protein n=1 Tax=Microdochium trichocladiopsis TaxID=1682393 RepID=A0A9P9BJ86_9PEZI|nr:uncharacterized protein B0I36DRAFT_389038 [Microdochium trichocladiopsis]KAH7016478.1 hypothetical protein B0I36DRAFT_389038 [Microdochium trichocladiopsis]
MLDDRKQREDMIESLVREFHVDVNVLGRDGTALHIAIQSEETDTVDLLLNLGADVHVRDHLGQDALEYAISHNKLFPPRLAQLSRHTSLAIDAEKRRLAARIIQSQTHSIIRHLCALVSDSSIDTTVEQKLDVVEHAWRSCNIEEELTMIWARNLSLAALQWYIVEVEAKGVVEDYMVAAEVTVAVAGRDFCAYNMMLVPDVQEPASRVCDSIETEPSEAAQIVARYFMPTHVHLHEKLGRELMKRLSDAALRALSSIICSPDAQLFVKGREAQYLEEDDLYQHFVHTQGWELDRPRLPSPSSQRTADATVA